MVSPGIAHLPTVSVRMVLAFWAARCFFRVGLSPSTSALAGYPVNPGGADCVKVFSVHLSTHGH